MQDTKWSWEGKPPKPCRKHKTNVDSFCVPNASRYFAEERESEKELRFRRTRDAWRPIGSILLRLLSILRSKGCAGIKGAGGGGGGGVYLELISIHTIPPGRSRMLLGCTLVTLVFFPAVDILPRRANETCWRIYKKGAGRTSQNPNHLHWDRIIGDRGRRKPLVESNRWLTFAPLWYVGKFRQRRHLIMTESRIDTIFMFHWPTLNMSQMRFFPRCTLRKNPLIQSSVSFFNQAFFFFSLGLNCSSCKYKRSVFRAFALNRSGEQLSIG